MSRSERPLLDGLRAEIGALGTDLRQMLVLRWQLARLEVESALAQIKRLSVVLAICGLMAVTALPILVIALAAALASWEATRISLVGWLLILGLGLLIGGATGGYAAWRRFGRRFVGIEQTLEELREDAVWLRQWTGREEEADAESEG